jgi:hypothetical protein
MRGRILPKLFMTIILVLVIVMIIKQPAQAADNATGIAEWFSAAADSFATFFNQLFY